MDISCRVYSLEPDKYSDRSSVVLKRPSECPICKSAISPIHLHTVFRIENLVAYFESHQFCTRCNHSFICSYTCPTDPMLHFLHDPDLKTCEPKKFKEKEFDTAIASLSPQFVKIYNQALAAEAYDLDEIAGLGYRKALEFLIKDFAIHEAPASEEVIKNMPLSQCIKNYITVDNLKTLAERSAWIGNDEAHYVRKQEDRDVSDMKSFIQAIVYFIGMILITEDAASMTPK